MKRFFSLICTLFLISSLFVYAQDKYEEEDDDIQDIQEQHENANEVEFIYNRIQKGDQYFRMALGLTSPLNFGNPFTDDGKLKIGGLFNLGYHYFFNSYFAVGIDAGFGFNVTIGSNVFNYVPIFATITYQPTIGNFEFPLTAGVGMAWETYSNYTYWPALVLKGEAGVHYRITNSWSLGGDISYMFMPQFTKLYTDVQNPTNTDEVKSSENWFGHFLGISVTARYYF